MEPITKELIVENGDRLVLTYEIIEQGMRHNYGLRLKAERHSPVELVEIPDITTNLLEIKQLLMVLSTYSVTPTTACDILEDFAASAHPKE